jgi:hypothetical protein
VYCSFRFLRYKSDIKALNQLLDSNEEAKLEEVKKLVREIQELRRKSPQVNTIRDVQSFKGLT